MKVLIHYSFAQGPVGAWRVSAVGERESFYRKIPAAQRLKTEAGAYLDAKGTGPTWDEWLTVEMAGHSPYGGSGYAVVDANEDDALSDVLAGVNRARHTSDTSL